jgi:hypothetical protein
MPREPEFPRWRERWLRRGELLTVAAFTSSIAVAASGKWTPLGVALGALAVGVYVICAAEAGWWLPGRESVRQRDSQMSAFSYCPRWVERRRMQPPSLTRSTASLGPLNILAHHDGGHDERKTMRRLIMSDLSGQRNSPCST